jgi:hypothetical protein
MGKQNIRSTTSITASNGFCAFLVSRERYPGRVVVVDFLGAPKSFGPISIFLLSSVDLRYTQTGLLCVDMRITFIIIFPMFVVYSYSLSFGNRCSYRQVPYLLLISYKYHLTIVLA